MALTRRSLLRWDKRPDQTAPQRPQVGVQGRPRSADKVSTLPPTWPLARMLLPIKFVVCSQTSGNTVAELLFWDNCCLQVTWTTEPVCVPNGTRSWATYGNAISRDCYRAPAESVTAPSKGPSGWEQCPPFDSEVLGPSSIYWAASCLQSLPCSEE